ncbi:MAG TPA: NUDIX domain-containing protein [Intrasporangiaceae bacterium]|nr:NUDIX domain-containing protein [Intrasporangiaceae bacterium]
MTPIDRSHIRVKAMLIAPNDDVTAHVVALHPPTAENASGYHRLIGGSVELGESHGDAIVREVDEELGATIRDLTLLTAGESIFRIDGVLGHEIVFLYMGRLEPSPNLEDASLTEIDGTVVPVVWRPIHDRDESLPLYPSAAVGWVHRLSSERPTH